MLPLDPVGDSPTNKVTMEEHILTTQQIRLFAPLSGAFYVDSMELVDLATNLPLVKDVDYYPAELMELPSGLYNSEICAIIVIKNPAVSNQVAFSYQALGDFYSQPENQVVAQMGALSQRPRNWNWGPIITPVRPSQYPPQGYLNRNSDQIGFEYLERAIDRIKEVLIGGFPEAHQDVYDYLDTQFGAVNDDLMTAVNALDAHIADDENPHEVSRDQLGVFSEEEVDTMVSDANTSISARLTALTIAVNNHVQNFQNPHGLTAGSLQMYTKPQVDALLLNMQLTAPKLDNGFLEVLSNGDGHSSGFRTTSWSHYNDQPASVLYNCYLVPTFDMGPVSAFTYVNGSLIADVIDNSGEGWGLSIAMWVPSGGTIQIVGSSTFAPRDCSFIVSRFHPTA